MWCSTCQQDVAVQKSPEHGDELCGKCGQLLAQGGAASNAAALATNALLAEDDWTIEADMRGLERLVGSLKRSGLAADSPVAVHGAHSVPEWHAEQREETHSRSTLRSPIAEMERPKSHLLAWVILSVGLATFACGAVLLVWSVVGQREDLSPVGMPLALVGQAGLVLGLILQLDGVWQTSRKTAETLTELDGELARVRQATTVLSTSRTAAGQSFYAHLAQGAAPQLLLADLKGQLDLLAHQMAERR
jgi:hypothetical protein